MNLRYCGCSIIRFAYNLIMPFTIINNFNIRIGLFIFFPTTVNSCLNIFINFCVYITFYVSGMRSKGIGLSIYVLFIIIRCWIYIRFLVMRCCIYICYVLLRCTLNICILLLLIRSVLNIVLVINIKVIILRCSINIYLIVSCISWSISYQTFYRLTKLGILTIFISEIVHVMIQTIIIEFTIGAIYILDTVLGTQNKHSQTKSMIIVHKVIINFVFFLCFKFSIKLRRHVQIFISY